MSIIIINGLQPHVKYCSFFIVSDFFRFTYRTTAKRNHVNKNWVIFHRYFFSLVRSWNVCMRFLFGHVRSHRKRTVFLFFISPLRIQKPQFAKYASIATWKYQNNRWKHDWTYFRNNYYKPEIDAARFSQSSNIMNNVRDSSPLTPSPSPFYLLGSSFFSFLLASFVSFFLSHVFI